MSSRLPLGKNGLAVGELPNINGQFGCGVPNYHSTKYANGVFSGTNFGVTEKRPGASENGNVFGYSINFGNNERHNNVAPCVSAYLWQRTV